MEDQFSRTRLLIGNEAVNRLYESRVAIFGIGGVGGYVCEALARSGVGKFDLIDNDDVSLSNINRQIIATHKTVGRPKVLVMREHILDINPNASVKTHQCFFLPENADEFHFEEYDYVVDAVDTVTAKLEIIMRAKAAGVKVISSMGAGNKLDAGAFKVADIYDTKVCPLAKVMRRELKKRGVDALKVVYSEEMPLKPGMYQSDEIELSQQPGADQNNKMGINGGLSSKNNPCRESEKAEDTETVRRSTPGSMAFVPSVAGLLIAGEVVKDLIDLC